MTDPDSKLLAILRIGHETSRRAVAGISLREALARTGYKGLRPAFGPADLVPLIKADPTLAHEWIAYSDDKRTDGGWYLTEEGAIGRVPRQRSILGLRLPLYTSEPLLRFDSLEEATAEYVVRELDFWANLSKGR